MLPGRMRLATIKTSLRPFTDRRMLFVRVVRLCPDIAAMTCGVVAGQAEVSKFHVDIAWLDIAMHDGWPAFMEARQADKHWRRIDSASWAEMFK